MTQDWWEIPPHGDDVLTLSQSFVCRLSEVLEALYELVEDGKILRFDEPQRFRLPHHDEVGARRAQSIMFQMIRDTMIQRRTTSAVH